MNQGARNQVSKRSEVTNENRGILQSGDFSRGKAIIGVLFPIPALISIYFGVNIFVLHRIETGNQEIKDELRSIASIVDSVNALGSEMADNNKADIKYIQGWCVNTVNKHKTNAVLPLHCMW